MMCICLMMQNMPLHTARLLKVPSFHINLFSCFGTYVNVGIKCTWYKLFVFGFCFFSDQAKPSLHVTSLDDAECLRSKELLSTPSSHTSSGSKSTRNIPRRHTVGGPRSSKEILGMQTSEMDRKREAFLEHLKQKYPHHATAIMGHQERLRDQVRKSNLYRVFCLTVLITATKLSVTSLQKVKM